MLFGGYFLSVSKINLMVVGYFSRPQIKKKELDINFLIEECIKKNPKAERELYYLNAKRIFGICRRYSTDDQQAEDYMQDSFEKIFKNLKKYDQKKAAFSTWTTTITVNTILSDKKKRRVSLFYKDVQLDYYNQLVDHTTEYDETIGYDINPEQLVEAIRNLPEKYRKVLNLYIFENWKHNDIAALLKIEVSSSRSILTRAKQMLKKKFNDQKANSYERKLA